MSDYNPNYPRYKGWNIGTPEEAKIFRDAMQSEDFFGIPIGPNQVYAGNPDNYYVGMTASQIIDDLARKMRDLDVSVTKLRQEEFKLQLLQAEYEAQERTKNVKYSAVALADDPPGMLGA